MNRKLPAKDENLSFKLRSETNQYFAQNSLKGRIIFESDVMESITRSVFDNIGIAFLPQLYVAKELQSKDLYMLGPPNGYWKHRICLACHAKSIDDELIKSLSQSFIEVCCLLSKKLAKK